MREKKIEPGVIPPQPPEHLSEKSKQLWAFLVAEKIQSRSRQVLLLVGLESLDRAEQARQAIEKEGLVNTTVSTGAVHIHPATKIERESKALFAKIWSQLGLDLAGQERWAPD